MEMGSPSDRVFPPTRWGPYHAPDGLVPGATIYHGITWFRYPVVEVEENAKLWFHLPSLGPDGGYGYLLEPHPDGTRLVNALSGKFSGPFRWAWPVVWALVSRILHDAETEDLLASIERAATGRYAQRIPWPAYARFLLLFRPLMVLTNGPGTRSIRARATEVRLGRCEI